MEADRSADAPVRTTAELLTLLDNLLEQSNEGRWNAFFADRTRPVPFFVQFPDEPLVSDFECGSLQAGRVLELGCGNGRNAIYLADRGCSVDGVDFSETAIAWAKDRTQAAGANVHYIHGSIFDLDVRPASYDMVYDSGCFHHVAPHRRASYLQLVTTALKPGGILSMICFSPDDGSGLTDLHVYEQRTLRGGLQYTEQRLRTIFEPDFTIVTMRRMREVPPGEPVYGKDFLWAVRMQKRTPA